MNKKIGQTFLKETHDTVRLGIVFKHCNVYSYPDEDDNVRVYILDDDGVEIGPYIISAKSLVNSKRLFE